MLDIVKAQKLIIDVPGEELVLRTMHQDKVIEITLSLIWLNDDKVTLDLN